MEKVNLPTQGQQCLLVGSVLELMEEIKHYVSFCDEAIFNGMGLPEGSLTTQSEETTPKNAQPAYVDPPTEEATMKILKRNKLDGISSQIDSLGGRRCYTPTGWLLPLGRFLPSLKAPSGDLIVGVLGRGWFNASGQMRS